MIGMINRHINVLVAHLGFNLNWQWYVLKLNDPKVGLKQKLTVRTVQQQ